MHHATQTISYVQLQCTTGVKECYSYHLYLKLLSSSKVCLFQARPLLSDALETQDFGVLADPRLNGNFVPGEMFRLIEAAAACVRHSSAKRPTMGQVRLKRTFK